MTTDHLNARPVRPPQRAGAILGVVGSAGAFVGNLMHPNVAHDESGIATIATSAVWVPAHLLIAVSLLLMTVGLVAVADALADGPAGGVARAGAVSAIIGGSVAVVLMAADGVAARVAAMSALSGRAASVEVSVVVAGFAERGIAFGLVVMLNVVFGGTTFVLLGLAVLRDGRLPRWSGAVLALVGLASISIGGAQASIGESPEAIEIATILTPVVFTLWTAWMCGLVLARRVRVIARS